MNVVGVGRDNSVIVVLVATNVLDVVVVDNQSRTLSDSGLYIGLVLTE